MPVGLLLGQLTGKPGPGKADRIGGKEERLTA
jgi:hypothetical protein